METNIIERSGCAGCPLRGGSRSAHLCMQRLTRGDVVDEFLRDHDRFGECGAQVDDGIAVDDETDAGLGLCRGAVGDKTHSVLLIWVVELELGGVRIGIDRR